LWDVCLPRANRATPLAENRRRGPRTPPDDGRRVPQVSPPKRNDGFWARHAFDVVLLIAAAVVLAVAVFLALRASEATTASAGFILGVAAISTLGIGCLLLGMVAYRMRRDALGRRDARHKGLAEYVVLAGLPFLVLAGGVLTYYIINRSAPPAGAATNLPDQLAITFFLAFSVIALLLALSMTAVFFSWANLADARQALGLPEGSVRAVISLALIVIFAITAIFLYSRVSTSSTFNVPGLTADEVQQIPIAERLAVQPDPTPSSTPTVTPDPAITPDPNATPTPSPSPFEPTFTVTRLDPGHQAGNDLAQQIITTISTLVVAVSAFYFGTSSVKSAAEVVGAGGALGLRITSPRSPIKLKKGETGEYDIVEVSVQATPASQAIKGDVLSGDTGKMVQLEPGVFRYAAKDPAAQVLLRFSLVGDPNMEALLVAEKEAQPEPTAPADDTNTDENDEEQQGRGAPSGGKPPSTPTNPATPGTPSEVDTEAIEAAVKKAEGYSEMTTPQQIATLVGIVAAAALAKAMEGRSSPTGQGTQQGTVGDEGAPPAPDEGHSGHLRITADDDDVEGHRMARFGSGEGQEDDEGDSELLDLEPDLPFESIGGTRAGDAPASEGEGTSDHDTSPSYSGRDPLHRLTQDASDEPPEETSFFRP
jgi:hypothetical protein